MGHNRARDRYHARLKRRKREQVRLAAKAAAADQPTSVLGTVTSAVSKAMHAVSDTVKAAVQTVTGK